MAKIVFYKQARDDGGIHTGIEVNGITCYERFEIEGEEYDPALIWYVEVYCEGDELPDDAAGALSWLKSHAGPIKDGLQNLAAKVQIGLDHNTTPLHWPVSNAPHGVSMKILCDVARRRVGLDMAKLITDLGLHLEGILQRLPEAHAYTL
jgi:hypothetical protein